MASPEQANQEQEGSQAAAPPPPTSCVLWVRYQLARFFRSQYHEIGLVTVLIIDLALTATELILALTFCDCPHDNADGGHSSSEHNGTISADLANGPSLEGEAALHSNVHSLPAAGGSSHDNLRLLLTWGMLRRQRGAGLGALMRQGLGPIASRLGGDRWQHDSVKSIAGGGVGVLRRLLSGGVPHQVHNLERGLQIEATVVSGVFVVDHLLRAWALGLRGAYYKQPLEAMDGVVVCATFVLMVVLLGMGENAAQVPSLLVSIRLWRVFNLLFAAHEAHHFKHEMEEREAHMLHRDPELHHVQAGPRVPADLPGGDDVAVLPDGVKAAGSTAANGAARAGAIPVMHNDNSSSSGDHNIQVQECAGNGVSAQAMAAAGKLGGPGVARSDPRQDLTGQKLRGLRQALDDMFESRIHHLFVVFLVLADLAITLVGVALALTFCGCTDDYKPHTVSRIEHFLGWWSLAVASTFLAELLLKVSIMGYRALKTKAEWFDATVVLVSFVLSVTLQSLGEQGAELPSLLATLRLWRLVKLVKGVEEAPHATVNLSLPHVTLPTVFHPPHGSVSGHPSHALGAGCHTSSVGGHTLGAGGHNSDAGGHPLGASDHTENVDAGHLGHRDPSAGHGS